MANFIDIAPALGRGIDVAQNLPGGYDAIDLRRMIGALPAQEGAILGTSYTVTQRAAGANMSVDVWTNGGGFLVQGDDVSSQGLYHVPATSAIANLDVAAADPTNPRLDQIVLEARDDAHTGDGITRARAYVLQGTPTAGATLSNRSGAAALPASTVRLADVLVGAGVTSITTANIRDRRPWARGAFRSITRTSGDISVTSTSYVNLDATNLAPRIECSGVPLRISLLGAAAAGGSTFLYVALRQDGVQIDERQGAFVATAASQRDPFGGEWIITPPAGSHVFDFQVRSTTGSAVTVYSNATNTLTMAVEEILRPNASNG